MDFLKKKDIFKLADDLKNVSYALDITNIYEQRSFSIFLKPLEGIDYHILGYFLGYRIKVSNSGFDAYKSDEMLYRKRFDPITLFKIKRIVREYEKIEKSKRLKRIKGGV